MTIPHRTADRRMNHKLKEAIEHENIIAIEELINQGFTINIKDFDGTYCEIFSPAPTCMADFIIVSGGFPTDEPAVYKYGERCLEAHAQFDREYYACTGETTPLHLAAKQKNTAIIELLILHGADCKPLDKDNKTPLDIMKDYGLDNSFIDNLSCSVNGAVDDNVDLLT